MKEFVQNMTPAKLSNERKRQVGSPLTAIEEKMLRALVGQGIWLARMGMPELAVRVSKVAGKMTKPVVQDLLDANTFVRFAKKVKMSGQVFSSKLKLDDPVVAQVSDSAFDNLPGHRSQRGHMVVLADADFEHKHQMLQHVSFIEWKSTEIKRVVRSTLAAEAYSASEASESMDFIRAMVAEIKNPEFEHRHWLEEAAQIRGLLIADRKSLFDVVATDLPKVSDHRLALECMILKELKNVGHKWLPSQQMIADGLTKEIAPEGTAYALTVRETGLWTCGPDSRAPKGRVTLCRVMSPIRGAAVEKRPPSLGEDDMAVDSEHPKELMYQKVGTTTWKKSRWATMRVKHLILRAMLCFHGLQAKSISSTIETYFVKRRTEIGALSRTENKKIEAQQKRLDKAQAKMEDLERKAEEKKAKMLAKSKAKSRKGYGPGEARGSNERIHVE